MFVTDTGTYLVHPYLFVYFYGTMQRSIVYSDPQVASLFVSTLLFSFLLAAVLFVLVELPCANLVALAIRK